MSEPRNRRVMQFVEYTLSITDTAGWLINPRSYSFFDLNQQEFDLARIHVFNRLRNERNGSRSVRDLIKPKRKVAR